MAVSTRTAALSYGKTPTGYWRIGSGVYPRWWFFVAGVIAAIVIYKVMSK